MPVNENLFLGKKVGMSNKPVSCEFCSKFSTQKDSAGFREWYDAPLFETEDFVAVSALGQIAEGYLLIIPRKHILSMAQLQGEQLNRFNLFWHQVVDWQTRNWDIPIIFEHGACHEFKPTGACINHAHWHLVPGQWDILPSSLKINKYSSFEDYANYKKINASYLLFVDQVSTFYVSESIDVPSQYFRRLLAKATDRVDEWDYLVFPFFENIKATLRKAGILQI